MIRSSSVVLKASCHTRACNTAPSHRMCTSCTMALQRLYRILIRVEITEEDLSPRRISYNTDPTHVCWRNPLACGACPKLHPLVEVIVPGCYKPSSGDNTSHTRWALIGSRSHHKNHRISLLALKSGAPQPLTLAAGWHRKKLWQSGKCGDQL